MFSEFCGLPYQEGKEAVRGSIEVGKVADFQVLDRDIFAVAHEEIGASRVVMTMVGGNVVFQD
ncbi:TPA: amidohydrolase family protein [Klebsiella pneumoniae]